MDDEQHEQDFEGEGAEEVVEGVVVLAAARPTRAVCARGRRRSCRSPRLRPPASSPAPPPLQCWAAVSPGYRRVAPRARRHRLRCAGASPTRCAPRAVTSSTCTRSRRSRRKDRKTRQCRASAARASMARREPRRRRDPRRGRHRAGRCVCRAAGADGVMRSRGGVLERLLHVEEQPVIVRAAAHGGGVLIGAWGPSKGCCRVAIEQMRFALGVDDDLASFHSRFRCDPLIGRLVRRMPWLRPTRRPEPFEALAWAICEQLIEYVRAAGIERRIVRRAGAIAGARILAAAARRAERRGTRGGRAGAAGILRPLTRPGAGAAPSGARGRARAH